MKVNDKMHYTFIDWLVINGDEWVMWNTKTYILIENLFVYFNFLFKPVCKAMWFWKQIEYHHLPNYQLGTNWIFHILGWVLLPLGVRL